MLVVCFNTSTVILQKHSFFSQQDPDQNGDWRQSQIKHLSFLNSLHKAF